MFVQAAVVAGDDPCGTRTCLEYDGKAYFTSYGTFNLNDAGKFCEKDNATLAVISTSEHMEMLKSEYIRLYWSTFMELYSIALNPVP